MSPLVSVVVNNFNYGRFLADAVESALGQTLPGVEVIVVDDGSTDGSREMLGEWDGRIRAVLKENGGQASALNAGWAVATGDLVLFLDADDVLLPDTAARVVDARARAMAGGSRVAAVWYPVEVVDGEQRPMRRTLPADRLAAGDLTARIVAGQRCPAPPTSGTALDRRLADPLFPIPEAEWRISADAYLALLSPLMGDVAVLDSPGARYRLHGGNRWVAADGMALDRIHDQLRIDRQREETLRRMATTPIPADWLLRDPEHLQFRLASLRLDPAAHPIPHDTRTRLALRGLVAALRTSAYRPRKRILFAVWFLLSALAPRGAAVYLIGMGFGARKRTSSRRDAETQSRAGKE